MFCFYFVLSLDVCIVTITWSLLFVVIALWVICLTLYITLAPHSSSALPTLVCFHESYRVTGKNLALLADMETLVCFHARKCGTRKSDSLLGLCNPPRRSHGEPAKPRLLYPLMCIPCCDTVSEKLGS
jgi:hypothetical protein